jgi:hypothetical protein
VGAGEQVGHRCLLVGPASPDGGGPRVQGPWRTSPPVPSGSALPGRPGVQIVERSSLCRSPSRPCSALRRSG